MTAIADNSVSTLYERASDGNSWMAASDVRCAAPDPEPTEHYVSAYCAGCGKLCMVDASVFDIACRALCYACHRLFGHRVAGVA